MMKNAVMISAIAGIAAAASAQSVALNFSADASSVNVGDTINWTVSASYSGLSDSGYFGGFVGSFVASDAGLGTAGNFANLMAGEGVPATGSGADVNDLNVFNSALLQTNDSSIGDFFTFSVVATAEGDLSYGAAGVATLFDSDFIFAPAIEFSSFGVTSDSVAIVPAPGAAALLGLGGLVATRRRR
jgi:MYXO-CTERM domain-containing protein